MVGQWVKIVDGMVSFVGVVRLGCGLWVSGFRGCGSVDCGLWPVGRWWWVVDVLV